jgi:Na+-driven multidrug efflux pump
MRTPTEQIRKADRVLILAIIICLAMGVIIFAFSLNIFLKDELQRYWNKPAPIPFVQSLIEFIRVLVYWAMPVAGVVFFAVGYVIWNYRRKRGIIKDLKDTDA